MTQVVSPSKFEPLSSGQIVKLTDLIIAGLRKDGANLPLDVCQVVIEKEGGEIVKAVVHDFRKRVEIRMKMIVRRVKVNRTLKSMDVIDATGRNKYVDDKIVATMPRGEGEEVVFAFFKPEPWEYTRPWYISDSDLEKALDRRGLKPDPYAQAKVNEDDPAFADQHPNGTHWKDGESYNFATFYRWRGRRGVYVDRRDMEWNGFWFFGGSRK